MLPLAPWSLLSSRRGESRTRDLELIRLPLSPLSYAPARVGPEGVEPPPPGLKVRCAAGYTTTPGLVGVSVCIDERTTSPLSSLASSVVALRVELSTTRLSAVFGRPALDYRASVGHPGVEPRPSCSQSRRASICTSARWSVRTAGFEPAISWPPTRRDNQASPRPASSTPWGSRTQTLPGFVVPAPVHWTGHGAGER